ncbi:kelch-like protein 34 [Acipenser oxyrinchus oxyrinchus]|uniref:Kelch-like protein 34 n=1 Tax=Acipenser oxyrinchus oxyrinchus TaxID=40147 RepID=A0AAD8DGS3_ACIOX|nr:kelch-like protein 34 [Acipenser oxyrinchus oxyrinchus]
MSYFLVVSRTHGETVLTQYQRLREEQLLFDIVLVADGTEFPAHRSLLACSSDYFRVLFKGYTRESKASVIHLQVVSSTGLHHVLDFIYTSWLSLSPETLEDTLEAAGYLQVTEAIGICSQYITNNLSLENCCFFANVASRFGLRDALSAANRYISRNLCRLPQCSLDSETQLDLNPESMMAVVGSDDMPRVTELQLLVLVLEWLKNNPLSVVHNNLLLGKIRYGLIPVEELTNLYSQNEVLQTAYIKSLVLNAMRYHSLSRQQPLNQCTQSTVRTQRSQIILIGGGTLRDGLVGEVLAFNPYLKTFRAITDLKRKVQNHCVCVVGNFLYVLGGEVVQVNDNEKLATTLVTNQVCRYDPRFNKWLETAGMIEKRARFSCCTVEDNIFAIGGSSGINSLHSSVEVYDINTDKWEKVRDLPQKMHGHACTVYKDTIYISGGMHENHRESSKEVYSFNLLDGLWKKRAAMSIARFGHQMATMKEKIFAFLGMYEPFCDIERYDPVENQWTRLRPVLYDRFCYGMAVMDSSVLMIGGKKWHNSQELATQNVIEYDVDRDSWKEVCKLPCPLYGLQCAVLQLLEVPYA